MAADWFPDFDRTDISPLLLSDEDSMGTKRKEITNHELEASSSRKKKINKKNGKSRPACCWVHFRVNSKTSPLLTSAATVPELSYCTNQESQINGRQKSKHRGRFHDSALPLAVQSNSGRGVWSSTAVAAALNNVNAICPIPVVLTDPDILDCPICLEPLRAPIYQCANGHITCNPCGTKLNHKCPSCRLPIGPNRCRAMEKLIDSITVDCKNKAYGCRERLIYHSKAKHEQECPHILCYCPFPSCRFFHLFQNLYDHFSVKHFSSAYHIHFDATLYLVVKRDQKHVLFAEWSERVIFVLNHDVLEHGRVFGVDCVGPPNLLKNDFVYKFTVRCGDTCFTMESVPEVFAKWEQHTPTKSYLTIPSVYPRFSIELCIKKAYLVE